MPKYLEEFPNRPINPPRHHDFYNDNDDDQPSAADIKHAEEEIFIYIGFLTGLVAVTSVAFCLCSGGFDLYKDQWDRGAIRQTPAFKIAAFLLGFASVAWGIYFAHLFEQANRHTENKFPLERAGNDFGLGALIVSAMFLGSGALWCILNNLHMLSCLCTPDPGCCTDKQQQNQSNLPRSNTITVFSSQAQAVAITSTSNTAASATDDGSIANQLTVKLLGDADIETAEVVNTHSGLRPSSRNE